MANILSVWPFLITIVFLLDQLGTCAAFTPSLLWYLTEAVGPYQPIDPEKVSKECLEEYTRLSSDREKLITVVDSIGKPAAGFLEGNLAWIGHYDQCMGIKDYKYCTVQMQLNATELIPGLMLPISWGVCAPVVCNTTDINSAIGILVDLAHISQYFYASNIEVASTVCEQDPPEPCDVGFILMVLFCSAIFLISIYADLLEYIPKIRRYRFNLPWLRLQDAVNPSLPTNMDDMLPLETSNANISNEGPNHFISPNRGAVPIHRFLQCFSFRNNLSKLLDTNKSGDNSISCLSGIRVITIFWIIMAHTGVYSMRTGALENPQTGKSAFKRFGFQVVANAFFAVDTFFLISGFLLAFLTLSRMAQSRGRIPWFWFYFHKFWRITPIYIFIILIWMFLMPVFGQGPFWHNAVHKPFCRQYWWTNLLYINNFWPRTFTEQCLGWTWYLANDMQFFLISPVFLLALFFFPFIGALVMVGTVLASFAVTATLIGNYDLYVHLGLVGKHNDPPLDFNSLVYMKPYAHIAPYLVGIALGYLMYKIQDKKVVLNPVLVALGWTVATSLAVVVIYGLYPSYKGEYDMSLASRIMYGTFSRFVWALAIGWVIFACKYGYGGLVNDFLSWKGWTVPSRLTFTTYLIHPIVTLTFYFNFGSAVHYSLVLLSFYFVGSLGIAYCMATILSLIIEYPFANLEKLLMPKHIQKKRAVELLTKDGSVDGALLYASKTE